MTPPSITPHQAAALFGDDRGQTIQFEGFTITMDGAMMSPPSEWAPIAEKDGWAFYTSGEQGDPVDETLTWVGPYEI